LKRVGPRVGNSKPPAGAQASARIVGGVGRMPIWALAARQSALGRRHDVEGRHAFRAAAREHRMGMGRGSRSRGPGTGMRTVEGVGGR